MRFQPFVSLLLVTLCASLTTAGDIQTAKGEVTFKSATDTVKPIHSSSGDIPGRDVASLRIASDGAHLTLAATMTTAISGTFADHVVRLYVDTDNNPATGKKASWTDAKGFEYEVALSLCIDYENGGSACVGGAGKKAKAYFATAAVTDTATGQSLKHFWDLPKTPVKGKTVEARISYEDIGVKPGQSIRIYGRESSGPYDTSGYFPETLLTLK